MQRTIVKYKNLELPCNPDTVSKYREGKLALEKVLQAEEIFVSVSKGTRAKEAELQKVFGVTNVQECIETMLQKGTYQISAAERKARTDATRAEIIGYITRGYLDARNKLPIPYTRVEAAFEQLKVRIDAETSTDKQLAQILKKLPTILPLKKKEGLRGELRVAHKHVGGVQSIIRRHAELVSERYDGTGAIFEITISAGESDVLLAAVSKLTGDTHQFEILQ